MLFSSRNSRRSLLIETNPYQILAAVIDRSEDGSTALVATAEFAAHDDLGLRQWLADHFEKPASWVPAIASFVPPDALVQRESITPRKLVDPAYLTAIIRDQYRIANPAAWKFQTLTALEGELVPAEGVQRPVLVCGVSHTDVHAVQQRLLDQRLLPYRLEMGVLPLLGAIASHRERQGEKRAVVVAVIEQEHTTAYILGKEGVHTPAPVRHGFSSIVQAARREFQLTHAAEVRERLSQADEELLLRASKLVRGIGRDLKPLVDSYEMTTGQPVGEIYCAYLPPGLAWITEPLAQVTGRAPFVLEIAAWLPTVNLTLAEGVRPPGQHWLGALSLVAESPGSQTAKAPRGDGAYQGPWRLDTRISTALPSADLVRRRFITNTVFATLAAAAVMFALWLAYLARTSAKEAEFWEQRIADRRPETDALEVLTRNLTAAARRIDVAYALVGSPYPVTDFLMALGAHRPAALQIDAVDSLETGALVRGVLHEPSDKARGTLARYREQLLAERVIGDAFASVALSSFSRRDSNGPESFEFELTFRLKPPQP